MQNIESSFWRREDVHRVPVAFPDLTEVEDHKAFQVVLQSLVRLFARPEITDWLAWAEDRSENVLWRIEPAKMRTEAEALLAYGAHCIDRRLHLIGVEVVLEDGSFVTFGVGHSGFFWELEKWDAQTTGRFFRVLGNVCVVDTEHTMEDAYISFFKSPDNALAARAERNKRLAPKLRELIG